MQAQLVGRLAMNEKRQAVFEYDTDWLKHGFSISPFELPLQAGLFTAKWYSMCIA
jgi:serine/threonine-protein kinase HipA